MKTYFPGLAALRAIAALVVVVGHVELLKSRNGIPNLVDGGPSLPDGHIAVVLFFVLSGFLISFILCQEKASTGRISFRNFYMRRILRIWPLYYFTVFLSLFVTEARPDAASMALTFAILPNIPYAWGIEWPASPQIWSIGVEEQFYILLPLLFRWVPIKRLPLLLLSFFVGYTLLPHVIGYVNVRTIQSDAMSGVVYRFFYTAKFNCMSIGCVLGVWVAVGRRTGANVRARVMEILYSGPIAYGSILSSFVLWFARVEFGYFTDEVYAVVFGVMILNLATNSALKWDFEWAPLRFLGGISYGMYMYHWLVIMLVMAILPYEATQTPTAYNMKLYSGVLAGTIVVSWLSFVSLERFFLNLKRAFPAT